MITEDEVRWTGLWLARKLEKHDEVRKVSMLSDQHLKISRKKYRVVIVGATSATRLGVDEFRQVADANSVSFVVNISKESWVPGETLALAEQRDIAIGGLGDIQRALKLPNVASYTNPEITFIERGLRQHSRVKSFQRLDDRRYRIVRHALDDVLVVFLNEYELTADHVRMTLPPETGPEKRLV
jgi:hypothetical protein